MIDTCTALDMCAIHVFIHEVVSSACHSVYLHSRFHRVSETAGGGAGGGAELQLGDPTLMVLGTGVLWARRTLRTAERRARCAQKIKVLIKETTRPSPSDVRREIDLTQTS